MKKLLYILLFVPLALFGQENYSLSFDGVDDEVLFTQSNDLLIHNDISILLDIKIQSISGYQTILAHSNYGDGGDGQENSIYTIEINNNTLQYIHEYGNGSNVILTIEDSLLINHWYRFAMIRNSSESRIDFFINDSLVSSQYYNPSPEGGDTGVLQFGRVHGETGAWYHGFIDNIQIWSSALSQSDVNAYKTCPPSGNEDGLVGYWDFNEGAGNIVYDISGNENHGTIYGATYIDDVPEINCLGCKNPDAINYDENAIEEDEQSCIYSQDYVHGLWNEVDDGAIEYEYLQEEYNALNTNSTNSTSSLQQALNTWNTTIDLSSGWNMFGYGCPNPINIAEGLSNHTDIISIVKDNNGNVYMPEFSFNGIGDFTPGFGYQIKVSEAIVGFSLCDWYVNDIPEDNIVSLQDSIINMHNANCIENGYCSFDNNNQICITPEDGYDCFGDELISHQVGDIVQGGIVFYVDETGQHGLVAAMEDLAENMSWNNAILASESFTAQGYSDWYIPSFEELTLMYMTIGNGGLQGNIGAFSDSGYWSSTLNCNQIPLAITFYNGDMYDFDSTSPYKTRLIRSF